MSNSKLRTALICVLVCVVPMQLVAADSASAMLYTSGSAWLNGTEVPKSAAVFDGDMVQTKPDSSANINASGSSVMVLSDSLVKFEGPAVEIEHGAVRVGTSSGMATKAGEVTIKPAGNSWTEFQVADVDGQVQIAATKGDLTIQDQEGTTTLSQGQTTTKDDTSQPEKKKKKRRPGAATAAGGGILSSSWAVYGGAAIIGGVTLWVLLQHDEPISPACPTNLCP